MKNYHTYSKIEIIQTVNDLFLTLYEGNFLNFFTSESIDLKSIASTVSTIQLITSYEQKSVLASIAQFKDILSFKTKKLLKVPNREIGEQLRYNLKEYIQTCKDKLKEYKEVEDTDEDQESTNKDNKTIKITLH